MSKALIHLFQSCWVFLWSAGTFLLLFAYHILPLNGSIFLVLLERVVILLAVHRQTMCSNQAAAFLPCLEKMFL